jgi:hypothetical protein
MKLPYALALAVVAALGGAYYSKHWYQRSPRHEYRPDPAGGNLVSGWDGPPDLWPDE